VLTAGYVKRHFFLPFVRQGWERQPPKAQAAVQQAAEATAGSPRTPLRNTACGKGL